MVTGTCSSTCIVASMSVDCVNKYHPHYSSSNKKNKQSHLMHTYHSKILITAKEALTRLSNAETESSRLEYYSKLNDLL